MKIDTYRSKTKPAYGLIVPSGVDPTTLQGDAAAAAAKLSPLVNHSRGVALDELYKGDLLARLETQIASEGAGLVKIEVTFSEVLRD